MSILKISEEIAYKHIPNLLKTPSEKSWNKLKLNINSLLINLNNKYSLKYSIKSWNEYMSNLDNKNYPISRPKDSAKHYLKETLKGCNLKDIGSLFKLLEERIDYWSDRWGYERVYTFNYIWNNLVLSKEKEIIKNNYIINLDKYNKNFIKKYIEIFGEEPGNYYKKGIL